MHHEQAAAFAAEGVGRFTGIPGVALATSGPGATNLLTAIGSCYFDSVPAVFITGQVNRNEQKGQKPIRQLGFQETDIVSMALPITKAAWLIQEPSELPELLNRAFALATSGRPGPVLLDIPMDIQRANLDEKAVENPNLSTTSFAGIEWEQINNLLNKSKKPLILAGGGIRSSLTIDLFRRFVDHMQLPVVHSLMGVDALPYGHPLRIGLIGSYGNRWANFALMRSDLLLVLGSRLDVRQTGSQVGAFKEGREIIHIDCDPGEINNRVLGALAVPAQLREFLQGALEHISTVQTNIQWLAEIDDLREKWPDSKELTGIEGINPNKFVHALSQASSQASAFVVDVGQNQMWTAQSIELTARQRYLTTGGMGSMGFALPAAIGVSAITPNSPVVMIAGDGGFQCNIQELQTIARNNFPLKMVLFNNHAHGMVRQFQKSYFDSRFQSTVWGYSAPNFVKVAEAYGIKGLSIEKPSEIPDALQWLWGNVSEPMLLEVVIDINTEVFPKVAFGKPISVMESQSRDIDGES